MKFEEIYSSALKPFSNYMTVERAKALGFIPPNFYEIFADHCHCGSERIARIQGASREVTALTCCDPRCPIKIVFQLNEVFERFKYKGIGPETCHKLVSDVIAKRGSVCLADILINGMEYSSLTGATELEFISAINTIKQSRVSFGKFVANLSYPFIGNKFETVLKGISNIDDFARVASKEGGIINFLAQRGVKSIDVIFHFTYYLKEIALITNHYKDSIIMSSFDSLPICMTGHMSTSFEVFTKESYLQQCNLLTLSPDGTKLFDVVSVDSVSKAAFVIVGEDSIARGTKKYLNALAREKSLQQSGHLGENEKFWYTPEDFLRFLLKGEENLE